MSEPVIVLDVHGLTKTYQSYKKAAGLQGSLKALFHRETVHVTAVDHISFSIRRGEFVGLLGPNGAGKTTTLKMLAGLIRPSAGSARALGQFDTAQRDKSYLQRIGMVMGQRNQLNADLPAIDSFRLSQAMYSISEADFLRRLDELLAVLDIRDKLTLPVRKLSLGERMKMELIFSLLHGPELLFLDEPTIGLDFNAAKQMRQFLGMISSKFGITTILTSHYTKDIEELCARVIIINHGKIYYDGPLKSLDPRLQGQKKIELTLPHADDAKSLREKLHNSAAHLGLEWAASEEPQDVDFFVPAHQCAAALAAVIAASDASRIADVKVNERPIDEIFGEIYKS